jgi:hypothetical protein
MIKTIIYIDGYNFYYSRLRHSAYKLLDVVALFESLLKIQDASLNLIEVKYFTSPVKASFSSYGTDSDIAQSQYHRALQAIHPEGLSIIKGFHIFEPSYLPLYEEGKPANKTNRVRVWSIEEKQTDVNTALIAMQPKDVRSGGHLFQRQRSRTCHEDDQRGCARCAHRVSSSAQAKLRSRKPCI